jgi:hypothetical protein
LARDARHEEDPVQGQFADGRIVERWASVDPPLLTRERLICFVFVVPVAARSIGLGPAAAPGH